MVCKELRLLIFPHLINALFNVCETDSNIIIIVIIIIIIVIIVIIIIIIVIIILVQTQKRCLRINPGLQFN